MEERSPNSEPDGSRRGRSARTARVLSSALVFASLLPVYTGRAPEARRIRADWVFGNREARPGLH